MTEVNQMPKEGQFVAMWEYNNTIWASSFIWEDGQLKEWEYNLEMDDVVPTAVDNDHCIPKDVPARYFVYGGNE